MSSLTFCNKKEEKKSDNFGDIGLTKATFRNYLKENCSSELYLQLSFKYFGNLCFIHFLLISKVHEVQTTLFKDMHEWVKKDICPFTSLRSYYRLGLRDLLISWPSSRSKVAREREGSVLARWSEMRCCLTERLSFSKIDCCTIQTNQWWVQNRNNHILHTVLYWVSLMEHTLCTPGELFRYLHHFVLAKLATGSVRVKENCWQYSCYEYPPYIWLFHALFLVISCLISGYFMPYFWLFHALFLVISCLISVIFKCDVWQVSSRTLVIKIVIPKAEQKFPHSILIINDPHFLCIECSLWFSHWSIQNFCLLFLAFSLDV